MKILHIIYDDVDNPWLGGGGAMRAKEINKHLAQKHSITTITGNFQGASNKKVENVHYIRIGCNTNYLLSRISYTLLIPFCLRKYDHDLLVNDFSVFSPVYSHMFTQKPIVNTFYHRIGLKAIKKFWFLGLFAYLFEELFLLTAKNIITISPSVTKLIKKKNDSRNIECIYTGINNELFEVETVPGLYIAYIGRLDIYMKGLDLLLKAYSSLPNNSIPLKIAGTGPRKNIAKLEKLIKKYNLVEKVSLLGKISNKEKIEFLRHALFVVMPSRFEGWGITAIEAAACGKAVIGTNIPGLRDAIVDNNTGLLVQPNDYNALSKAMLYLLQDEDIRSHLGANGKQWAQHFQWNKIADKQMIFYQSVLSDNIN